MGKRKKEKKKTMTEEEQSLIKKFQFLEMKRNQKKELEEQRIREEALQKEMETRKARDIALEMAAKGTLQSMESKPIEKRRRKQEHHIVEEAMQDGHMAKKQKTEDGQDTMETAEMASSSSSTNMEPPNDNTMETEQIKEEDDSGFIQNTIYVGDLPKNPDPDEVYTAFRACGKIADVQIMGRKGYAFVEYSGLEGMEKALKTMNGQFVCGRFVRVSRAMKRTGRQARGPLGEEDDGNDLTKSRFGDTSRKKQWKELTGRDQDFSSGIMIFPFVYGNKEFANVDQDYEYSNAYDGKHRPSTPTEKVPIHIIGDAPGMIPDEYPLAGDEIDFSGGGDDDIDDSLI